MSTKGRVKVRISWTVVSALALLVLVLLSGVFHSCCPSSENNSTKVIKESEVKADKCRVIDASTNRLIANIYVFELDGHRYAMNYGEHYFIHLASCPCHQNENSILTPSSSLFNW